MRPPRLSVTVVSPERLEEAKVASRYFHEADDDSGLRQLLREAVREIERQRLEIEMLQSRLTEEHARTRFWWSENRRKATT